MNLCNIAYKNDEVPIGAVVVYKNQIIGKGYNQRVHKNDVTAHAEVIAIKEAEQYLGDWRLNDCDLYVTLKPCNMCTEIIKESRINNVYYLIEKLEFKKGYDKANICLVDKGLNNEIIDNYKRKLTTFFKSKCNR